MVWRTKSEDLPAQLNTNALGVKGQMWMRKAVLYLFCLGLWPALLSGQLLPEVPVFGHWEGRQDGASLRDTTSLDFAHRTADQIGQTLQMESALWIRQSVPGSYASVSYRGFSSAQTQLSWEGIPLNSPALAVADLNAVPSAAADELAHITGGALGLVAGNAAGGILELRDRPLDEQASGAQLGLSTGSFGLFGLQAEVRWKQASVHHQIRLGSAAAENNYPYRDVWGEDHLRQGADYQQQMFKYRLLWKQRQNRWSYAIWWQDQSQGIPDQSLVTTPRAQRQEDLFVRQMLQFKSLNHRLRLAWLYEEGIYQMQLHNLYDFNAAQSVFLQWEYEGWNKGKNGWSLGSSLAHQYAWGLEKSGQRQQWQGYANYRWTYLERWRADLGGRLDLATDGKPLPAFNFTALYLPSLQQQWRIGFSALNRRPGLNDLYWQTGGNPNLEPEEGYMLEAAWKWDKPIDQFTISPSFLLFQSQMNQLVVWIPNGTLWSPENLETVQSHGLEAALTFQWRKGDWSLMTAAAYQYTWSIWTRREVEVLAPGVPVHRVRASAEAKHRSNFLRLSHQQSSDWQQLRDSGQLNRLLGLNLYDLQLGTAFRWKNFGFQCSLVVANLFDEAYQLQAYMPMPGRSWQIRMNINTSFSKPLKTNHP